MTPLMMPYPKRFKKPNTSRTNPSTGNLERTRKMPPRKQMVPRIFSRRVKKTSVLRGPMIAAMPLRNKIYISHKHIIHYVTINIQKLTLPIAIRPASNKSITPSIMKNTPNAVNPTPISKDAHEQKGRHIGNVLIRTLKVTQPHFLVLGQRTRRKSKSFSPTEFL